MRNRTIYSIAAILIMAILVGCGTDNVGTLTGPGHEASRFTLTVDNGSLFDGATVDGFTISEKEYDDHVLVNINAEGAAGLKAIYFDLEYDAELYRPILVEPTDAMGLKDDLLVLDVRRIPGRVVYGQVLTHPDWREGFTGSATVATVSFRKEACPIVRNVSYQSAPDKDLSRTTLALDNVTGTLSWYYYNLGDYNQDGLVTANDLTPIGQRYENSNLPKFDVATADSACDGNDNGLIEVSDITAIGQNYENNALGGYNIYEGVIGDVPVAFADGNGAGTLVINVEFVDMLGDKGTDRLRHEHILAAPTADAYYWVRPVHSGTSQEGIPSNGVQNVNPADQPVLTLTNPPAVGDGTSNALAYEVNITTDYIFTLFDPISATDVTNDALTTYTVSVPAAGTIDPALATLNVDNAFWGDFTVIGTYDGISSAPMFFTVPEPPEEAIYILPDPADADWAGVPAGDGTSDASAFVVLTAAFNPTGALEFSILANTQPDGSGDPYDVTLMTWDGWPPFGQTWPAPGTFMADYQATVPPMSFCGGYVFCEDSEMNASENNLYIESNLLP